MSNTTPSTPAAPAANVPGSRTRRSVGSRLLRGFVLLVVAAIGAFALYTWAALRYVYSDGERAGYVQKFSRKGWVCKTWEGELAMVNLPGQPAELFRFTVREDAAARQIEAGMGQRMVLTYEYHPGVPSTCFGETQYYVVGVRVVAGS